SRLPLMRPSSLPQFMTLLHKKDADAQAAFCSYHADYITRIEETVTCLRCVVRELREARDIAEETKQSTINSMRQAEYENTYVCPPCATDERKLRTRRATCAHTMLTSSELDKETAGAFIRAELGVRTVQKMPASSGGDVSAVNGREPVRVAH
ncbi:hypothetical protein FRC10_006078, partial [Ceratobasidium sp. 414]